MEQEKSSTQKRKNARARHSRIQTHTTEDCTHGLRSPTQTHTQGLADWQTPKPETQTCWLTFLRDSGPETTSITVCPGHRWFDDFTSRQQGLNRPAPSNPDRHFCTSDSSTQHWPASEVRCISPPVHQQFRNFFSVAPFVAAILVFSARFGAAFSCFNIAPLLNHLRLSAFSPLFNGFCHFRIFHTSLSAISHISLSPSFLHKLMHFLILSFISPTWWSLQAKRCKFNSLLLCRLLFFKLLYVNTSRTT